MPEDEGMETASTPRSARTGRANRGPSAGPANRRALIEAARTEFSLHGSAVPLSRIAKRAGVGQGSLYRHFRDRVELAAAVFREDLAQLRERVESTEKPYPEMMDAVTERAPETAALVDLLTGEQALPPQAEELRTGMAELVHHVRETSVEAGDMPEHATEEELAAAIRMLALTLAKTAPENRQTTAVQARRIIDAWFRTS